MAPYQEEQSRCERECARLCNDFIYHIDRRQYKQFINLFATDGLLDRFGVFFEGHGGLQKFCNARAKDAYVRHTCNNIRVDMTGSNSATGTSCATMYQALAEPGAVLPLVPTALPLFAEYTDGYVLTADGWKFSSRKICLVFLP